MYEGCLDKGGSSRRADNAQNGSISKAASIGLIGWFKVEHMRKKWYSISSCMESHYTLKYSKIEAEAPILWPPDGKSQFIRKDPYGGKDWRQEEKGMTEDEMVGWHHRLNGHEFDQAPGDGKELESLACCRPWGCKESDMTEWLDNNTLK